MKQTTSTASKYIQSYIFLIFTNICHIPDWILLIFKNALFFLIPLMTSLIILCSDPHNFLKEGIRKKVHKKIFVAHQKFSKIFHGPSIYV